MCWSCAVATVESAAGCCCDRWLLGTTVATATHCWLLLATVLLLLLRPVALAGGRWLVAADWPWALTRSERCGGQLRQRRRARAGGQGGPGRAVRVGIEAAAAAAWPVEASRGRPAVVRERAVQKSFPCAHPARTTTRADEALSLPACSAGGTRKKGRVQHL